MVISSGGQRLGVALFLCFAGLFSFSSSAAEGETKASPDAPPQVGEFYIPLSLAGTPSGGLLTIVEGGALDLGEPAAGQEGISVTLTVPTYATDSIPEIVARLNEAVNAPGSSFGGTVNSTIDPNDPSALLLWNWPLGSALLSMKTTDSGLDISPGVSGFSVQLDEVNDSALLAWSIPPGVVYDKIRIARNTDIITEIAGSATSYTHASPFDRSDSPLSVGGPVPDRWPLFLQYQVVGVKDGRPSDMATVVVQKPVFIATGVLADGQVGVPYSATVEVVGGITLPITWSLSVTALPPGLSLDTSNGEISGTPTAAGEYTFGIFAEDSHTPETTVGYRIIDLNIIE